MENLLNTVTRASASRAPLLSVNNFLDEIFLFDNMMCDWSGCYRGDYCWENFECFEKLVNESNLEEKIKIEILEGYKEEYGMNDDE